jgi:hypothetical protein
MSAADTAVGTPPAVAADAGPGTAAAAISTQVRDFRAWLTAYDEQRLERNRLRWPSNAAAREKHRRRG